MTVELIHNEWPLQRDVPKIDGNPATKNWVAENLVLVTCPWTIYFGPSKVRGILINRRVADSLKRVLGSMWEAVGESQAEIEKLNYHRYSGSYNYRPMRGGATLSMHSFGRAIDWDDRDNPQHSHHHLFTDDSLLVTKFKAEGWVWGGDWGGSSIDAMHVQACRVR